jgi:ABC-type bacteriocin/lantibiotic exporter with double-glycine peptidase domain
MSEDEGKLGAAFESATNPVHANLARVAEAFTAESDDAVPRSEMSLLAEIDAVVRPRTPAEACLAPTLALLGWAGESRYIREALPHFDVVNDCEDLCSVLIRLSYGTSRNAAKLCELRSGDLPCLFSRECERSDVLLAIDREPDGRLLVFDGKSKGWRFIEPDSQDGWAYRILALSGEDRSGEPERSWLWSVVLRLKPVMVAALVLSFFGNLAALTVPIFVIYVYDLGIGTKSTPVVILLGIGAGIVIATNLAFRQIRAYAMAYFGARIDALIGMGAFERLLLLPIAMIESASVGVQMSRLKQFESVRNTFIGTLATSIIDIPFIFFFLVAIAYWGGSLVWVSVSLIVAYAVLTAITIPMTRNHVVAVGGTKQRIDLLLHEIFDKRRAIRALGAEEIWIARHRDLVETLARQNYLAQRFNHIAQNLGQTLVSIAGIATLALGTLRVAGGSMTSGALIGVMALVWRVLSPLQSTYLSVPRLVQAMQTFRQVDRLMKIRGERNTQAAPTFHRRFKGKISLQRLVFRYPQRPEPVFRGVQLDIKPGQMIAVTGASGSGKTTLLRLLAGLYAPTAGAILVDDLDLRQIDPAEWRSEIAFLPEKTTFFYGTVSQNIRLARPDAEDAAVTRALVEMGLDTDADLLSLGPEKRLTSADVDSFPDALKQRLALARCFVKDAPIYLLDHPSASLDSTAEARLINKMNALKGSATIIFTTFRPSQMRLADRLILLKDGVVALDGPPDLVIERLATAA